MRCLAGVASSQVSDKTEPAAGFTLAAGSLFVLHLTVEMPLFSKYSGAGNDFVIVRGEELGLRDVGTLAAVLCPRASGVGVDGLITVRSLSEELVRLRFFNPDGSEFSTCGNGSRCAARYAVDRGLAPADHMLVTDDGEIVARVRADGVALEYALDARVEREVRAAVGKENRDAWLVRMGTAHLVVPVPLRRGGGFRGRLPVSPLAGGAW